MGKVKIRCKGYNVSEEYSVSIPNGKGKALHVGSCLNSLMQKYQFPMGKVKPFETSYAQRRSRVSIPNGKGKEGEIYETDDLHELVSIPNGKGKEIENFNIETHKEGVSIPNGKGKEQHFALWLYFTYYI